MADTPALPERLSDDHQTFLGAITECARAAFALGDHLHPWEQSSNHLRGEYLSAASALAVEIASQVRGLAATASPRREAPADRTLEDVLHDAEEEGHEDYRGLAAAVRAAGYQLVPADHHEAAKEHERQVQKLRDTCDRLESAIRRRERIIADLRSQLAAVRPVGTEEADR